MSYLPPTPPGGGLLPYWFLCVSAAAFYNGIQNYVISWQTKEVYSLKPNEVTPLAARLFAAWTVVNSMVRAVGAYHITDPTMFNMVFSTFLIAALHFLSEWLIFRTIKINRGSLAMSGFFSISLIWSVSQRSYYLGP